MDNLLRQLAFSCPELAFIINYFSFSIRIYNESILNTIPKLNFEKIKRLIYNSRKLLID
jgi:hypothetical protein